MPGILLNVDYSDVLTKLRVREVLNTVRKYGIPIRLDKITNEVIADSFYLHYREPILSPPDSINDDLKLWYALVTTYLSSDMYKKISELTRYNPTTARTAAIKLLRAYNSVLNRAERSVPNNPLSRAREASVGELVKNNTLRRELETVLKFYMGNVSQIKGASDKIARMFGEQAGREVADLLLDIDIDPYRARLAKMLEDIVDFLSEVPRDVDLRRPDQPERLGVPEGIRRLRRVEDIKDATTYTKMLYAASRELFAYKLASKSLSIRERKVDSANKLYVLVDKSGSMFYTVKDVFSASSTQKINWATALAIALFKISDKVIVRFFDQATHRPLANPREILRALLTVIPLGGTNITEAVTTAINDCVRYPWLRGYKLIIITDGEDDAVNPAVLQKAKGMFRSVKAILIGNSNYVIESNVPTIRVDTLDKQNLRKVLSKI